MTRTIATVLAIVALGVMAQFNTSPIASGLSLVGTASAQTAEAIDETAPGAVVDFVMGDPDAPVTMVEYASFTCPHCKTYHQGVGQEIKKNYVDTGKVKVIFREVYGSRPGLWAAMVARCGGEDRYFGLVELLFEQQSEWLDASDMQGIADNLRRLGRTAGLADDQIEACLSDQAKAEAMIALYQENVTRDDVQATPSFVIGGTTYTNMSYDRMSELLDAELGQ